MNAKRRSRSSSSELKDARSAAFQATHPRLVERHAAWLRCRFDHTAYGNAWAADCESALAQNGGTHVPDWLYDWAKARMIEAMADIPPAQCRAAARAYRQTRLEKAASAVCDAADERAHAERAVKKHLKLAKRAIRSKNFAALTRAMLAIRALKPNHPSLGELQAAHDRLAIRERAARQKAQAAQAVVAQRHTERQEKRTLASLGKVGRQCKALRKQIRAAENGIRAALRSGRPEKAQDLEERAQTDRQRGCPLSAQIDAAEAIYIRRGQRKMARKLWSVFPDCFFLASWCSTQRLIGR